MREVAHAAQRVPDLAPAQRARLVDALCEYERPRRHGMRDNFIVWVVLIGLTMLAGALGLPGWSGFVLGLALLTAVARALTVKALRWRLDALLRGER
jgi:hypothetical protein